MIGRLRDMADMVLIDTPPALALADAAIIAGHADGVIVLSNVGRTQRETLVGTLRVLRANAAMYTAWSATVRVAACQRPIRTISVQQRAGSSSFRRKRPEDQMMLSSAAAVPSMVIRQLPRSSSRFRLCPPRSRRGSCPQQTSRSSSLTPSSIGPEQRPADAILHRATSSHRDAACRKRAIGPGGGVVVQSTDARPHDRVRY